MCDVCVQVPGESLADNTLLKALLERVVLRGGSHDNRLLLAAVSVCVTLCVCVCDMCLCVVATGGPVVDTSCIYTSATPTFRNTV